MQDLVMKDLAETIASFAIMLALVSRDPCASKRRKMRRYSGFGKAKTFQTLAER